MPEGRFYETREQVEASIITDHIFPTPTHQDTLDTTFEAMGIAE